jgi:hypothetical protein
MRKATRGCYLDTRRKPTGHVFKISGDSISLKRRIQELVPLSSIKVDGVYDGRYNYARSYEV